MPTLPHRPLSSAAAALLAAGLVLGGLALARSGRAAPGAQLTVPPGPLIQPDPNAPQAATTPAPVALQSLDATHFVVVTREPRLVYRVGEEGRYANMIVNVVTYYSVQNGHLVPIEHVRVPPGWRALTVTD